MLLVALMILMGQAGYFQAGYWMNNEASTPVEPLATTTDGPMATFSTDVFPSLDADIRAGDLTDWTFWEDENGAEGFGPWDTSVKHNQNGDSYNSQHMLSTFDVDTASSLTFTNRLTSSPTTFATSTANLSLDLPFAAQLSFGYVTQNQNWNASELHVDVLQSGSVVTSTSIDHSGVSYTNSREGTFDLLVPAGVSTVSLGLDVSRASGQSTAGGFWLLHEFTVTAPNASTVMSLGSDHACVLASDGDVKCWGANNVGQLGQGHIENMGDEVAEMGQDLPYVLFPENTTAYAVSAGGEHTCYLVTTPTTDGMPLCLGRVNLLGYGWSDDGAIGDGYQEDASQMPDWPLPTGRHVGQIEAGWNHTCALFDDGSMGCWGDNTHGQLGTGNTSFLGDAADEVGDGLALVDLPADTTVTSMALGWDHTCVLYSTGDVACWGNNAHGQLGLGSTTTVGDGAGEMGSNLVNISLPSGVNATSITAGDGFTCAVFSDESIRCWGRNDVGQLGQGNTATYGDNGGETVGGLSAISLGSTYASGTKILDAGRDHVCTVIETSNTAGAIKCWGGNGDGQLGVGDAGSDKHRGDQAGEMGSNLETLGTTPAVAGLDVGGLMRFEVGDRFACLMRLSDSTDTDPQVQCWGASSQGRLGYGNTETLGDSSTDSIPSDDVQLKLNEAYAHASCLGTNLPTQVEVDTADAARHVKVLADDDACPVIVYTDDDASTVLMAVYHNNRWVEETVLEPTGDVVDLDAGIAPDGRVHVAWVETYSSSSNYVHHARKSMGQWSSTQVFPGSDEVGMLLYPDGGIELVLIQASSNYIRSSMSTDGGENWGLEISRDYGSTAAWSDLNVALDGDGVAYASYNVDGTLRVISRPAGGDGVGADDWTAHVDVRSDLSDDGDVERQSLVSSAGSLGGMLSVSLTNASADTAGNATVSACLDGWSSCTTAGDWSVDANLSGINSTTMAMAVDLDQNHYLAYNSSNGLMLTAVGAAGTAPPTTTLWPYGVEEVDLHWSSPGVLHAAVRNASDGHLWLVRVDGFGGIGMNVDLDGDGWLGIDEQACGTDAHDASSTPSDADGDGLCDDVDQVDDEVHPRGSRTIALGDAFGCAITGDVALDSTQPAVVCWGANDEQQVGNTTATAASTVSVDAAHGVDLPHGTVVVDLDAGERHACTVTTEGEVFCWGANDHGQLGRDTGHASAFAGLVELPDGVRALGVATGANHTCIHDQRGDVWCWGSNLKGQFGSHVFANPNGVVLLDEQRHPWLMTPWNQQSTNQFTNFVDGLSAVQLYRFGCCNHPGTMLQHLELSVPMDATLVLNLSAEDVDFGLDFYLDDVWFMGSNGGDVQSTWYNASVPLSAGEHTLEVKLSYRVGNNYQWDDFLNLNAALHGIDIVEGGVASSGFNLVNTLSNSTAPVMLLPGDHPISGLDAGQYETCATDANGNTTCWTGGAMTASTGATSAEWQSAIANASTASGCGFTYSGVSVDPLDTTFVYPSGVAVGTSDAGMTVTNHTSLPIDCSGLRVGTVTTVGSTTHRDWEDMHVVPVEPGRTYLIEVFTEDLVGWNMPSSGQNGRTNLRAFAPTSAVTQAGVPGQSFSQDNAETNRLTYTTARNQTIMIVGVESHGNFGGGSTYQNAVLEYNLNVMEVGSPHPDASLAYLYDTPLVKRNAETNYNSIALVGTPDVGPDSGRTQTCAVPLDGVGLVCENSNVMTDPNYSINLQYEDDANRTTSFSMGQTTACAVLNGSLACWGNETVGGLGDGGSAVSTTASPVSVSLPTGWVPVEVEVSDFDERACALLRNASNDKRVYCWGPDAEGSLGNGGGVTSTPTTAPATPVHLMSDVLDVHTDSFELDRQPWDIAQLVAASRTGYQASPCVRSYEGLVKCWNTDHAFLDWGEKLDSLNEMGENLPFVDLGTEVYATDLTQHTVSSDPKTCALLENGTVTCWGHASGSGVHSSVPGYGSGDVSANGDARRVVGTGTSSGVLTDAVDIARNCALLSNGTVRCWTTYNNRAHWEADLGGVPIVSLHEGGYNDRAAEVVCALHASLIRVTCFESSATTASNAVTFSNEHGLHDVVHKAHNSAAGYSGTYMLSGALTLTLGSTNAVVKNADEVPLKPGSLALNDALQVCGIGPYSAPVCFASGPSDLVEYAPEDFGGRVLALDGPCVLRLDAEVLCVGQPGERGVYEGSNDPDLLSYAEALAEGGTVHLDLRNPDTDGDGVKDLWDDDDDGDGVLDHEDAFPRDACATVDTDRDGRPDALVAACSSPLTEDDDDDDDGWSDLDEGTCGTNPTSNLHLPRDLDDDGTCDAADADMDGDGWDDADERMCSPQGTVLRSLPPAPVDYGDATVFLGGADRRTPMAALSVSSLDAGTHLLDLTEDDPMAKALKLSTASNFGAHRATNLGSSVAFTAYGGPSSGGVISYLLDVEDGALVPRSIGDEDSGYAFAPFLDADGQVMVIKGSSESLETLDGFTRDLDIPNVYPVQGLRLENGSLLVLSHDFTPHNDGSNSGTDTFVRASLSVVTWNHTFDAYDSTALPLTLPSSLTSSVITLRGTPGKMVADGEGQVHWILPTVNSTTSALVDHEHLIINGTAPYVHHVGAVTGIKSAYHATNSFGLDWTPAGGLRMSYVLSNLSVAVSELNASGVVSTTVLPGGTLATNWHRSVGHATDTAGRSTVLVTDHSATGETLLFGPALRVDPAADASWTPVDEDNDGVCDASLGAMLHFAEEDLLWEAGLFSAAEPLPFGGYEVTGVTALTSLPNGLVLNTTTGAISGTPTVALPEGQNVTLRITSNGATIDMVVLLRIAEPAMVSVGEFGTSSSPLNKASHMVTTEDGRRYTLSWHSTDTAGKVNGFSHTSSDLVLTGYRPNGSAVVNWTSNIRSYGWTHPLDLALDADGNPLVLLLAGSSSCSQTSCSSENDIEFPNSEQDILASEACTTLYSSNTECEGWGERKKLVLASFGEEGMVQWTQHVKHRAGNSSYWNNPGEEGVSWSSYQARQYYAPSNYGMMDDDYLSIAPDGGINLAIQFCAEAPLVGTFGGHEIHASRTGNCDDDDDVYNKKTNIMLASLTSDGEVEWLSTSDVSTSPSWDDAEVKRVDLDHTSDGKMLLSYTTNGQQTWGDLMLPLPDSPTSVNHRDHFLVMFDADGNALWYQHGNVTDGAFDVQSMVMDDGTVVVVRETARDGRAGAYLDMGVTNSTAGRPTSSVPAGTVAYNNTSLAEHPVHLFRFRASDGARLSDAPIMGVDMRNGFASAAPLGYVLYNGELVERTTSLSTQTDGDRIFVLVRTGGAWGISDRYDLVVHEGDGRRATAMATAVELGSVYQSTAVGFDASGMPVFHLRDLQSFSVPSGPSMQTPVEVTWAYDDGRNVDGLMSSVLRFASGLGHQAEHLPLFSNQGTSYRYTDLSESMCTSSTSALGESWSLVGTNGSTWLPSGLTFSSTCGRLQGTYPTTTTPNPYWLNMTVDGRVFSHEVMIGVAPSAIGFDLPATGTLTRGVNGSVYNTTLSGHGLLPATVSPALPNGLSLLANGSIVGTATANMTAAHYVVVVCNLWNDCDREVIELTVLEPLPNITYGGNNSLWFPRDSVVDESPVNTGGAVETWSMSGTLPMGLSFDNLSGRIAGTAILIQNTTSVNITATNNAGSFTVQVNVTVPGAGIALVFPASNLSLVNGTTMQNFGGQTTGETPASWAITPGLPLGLHLGSTNGTIYGTPAVFAAAANHTVTVTSISGATATFVLNIEVLEPVEQITLTLPLTSLDLTNNSAMQPFTGQTSGDAAVLWNVTPDLPTGLNFGTANGTLWGTPTNVSGPVVYTITAYTTSGANDSATLTITVSADFDNDGIPDYVDPDDDNDGVLDGAEEPGCSLDPDCDDDGYGDGVDAFPVDPTEWVDTDNDGIGNNADDDDDGDGWTETEETECGNHSDLDAMDQPGDLDNDGLCDALDDVDDRPIYLVLTETELLLPVNATMAPFEVLQFGADVRSWNVTPDLPLGLTIDSEGRISGTPTVVSNLAVYTINASNDLNWATVNLSIAVLDEDADFDDDGLPDAVDPDDDNDGWSDVDEAQCGPTDPFDAEDVPDDSDNDGICDLLDDVSDLQITVTHEPRELHLTVNVTMTPVEANVTGGDVITWSAMGELPAGLSLDAQNGTISGTPTEVVADVLVQIEANNSKHSTTTWVLITVHEDTDADGIANIVDDDDDNDGWLDSEEAVCATDPLDANGVPSDLDGDGTCDRADPDIDGDGWANVQEQFCSTDPRDTDDMPSDTDTDGICNLVDTDDDNDGWADLTETLCGTDPLNTTSVPVDANRDGSCDQDLAISLSYNVGDGWFGVGEAVNLTPDLGGFEADLWAIQPALPEGLTFGSMARTSSGAITGVPLVASPATTYTVWANNSVDNTSINTSFVLGVFADHDRDGLPDEQVMTEVGPLASDLDDDDDGYADSMEAACGSNPYDSSSVPEDGVEFDGVTCINADSETDDDATFPWWACCLLLLLLLLLLFFMRDREEVLGPEPERTTIDVKAESGAGTERDPFILKSPKPIAPMGSRMSKQTIRFHGMTPRIEVHLAELGARGEQGRFTMVDVKDEKLNGQILTADEKGALKIRLRFDDEAFNTVKGGHFESVLRFGRNSVYVRWPVEVLALEEEITPEGADDDEDDEKAEMEALMLAKQTEAEEAKAAQEAKEQAEKEAADAKAKADAEAKAKAEEEAAAAAEKEAKEKAEREAAEAKAKADAEAKKAEEEAAAAAAAEKEAKEKAKAEEEAAAAAAAKKEAKEKAEREAAEAKAAQEAKEQAEKEAAEAKAKAKAEAEAAAAVEKEAKEKAEREAAEAQAKKPTSTREVKKQEELERVKERAKTIDFKVLGVASTTELKEKVEKGATTLDVADADAFEEQGSASITDAKGSTMIAWTGKDGNVLTGVSGVTRVFAAAATLRAKDDLQVIKGIGPFIEEKLNALGITTYRQIANMTAKLEDEVNVAIEFFPGRVKRDQWVAQAKILLGMDAKLDQKALEQAEELERIAQKSDALDFDVLGVANVADADDLQRIKGIGPFIEDKLYALGIYTFRQVGNMTPEIEESVNVAIEFFPGRIKRDEWARQAREFADES